MTLIQQIIASKFDVIAVQGIRDRMRKAADELIDWVNLNPQNRKFEQVVSERVGEGSTREQFTGNVVKYLLERMKKGGRKSKKSKKS